MDVAVENAKTQDYASIWALSRIFINPDMRWIHLLDLHRNCKKTLVWVRGAQICVFSGTRFN